MAAPGKKDITVEVKTTAYEHMSSDAKKFLDSNPDLKKKFAKPFEWSKKVETDPKKHPKKDLDYEMLSLARYAMQLFGNRVNEAAKEKTPDLKKIEKDLSKYFDKVFKSTEDNCEKKLEDVLSGKEDNRKALRGGKAAFSKLDSVDFRAAFDRPRGDLAKLLSRLETDLNGKGDKQAAMAKAHKEVESIADDLNDAGLEIENAVDFLLSIARSIKNDRKADAELVEFGKKVLKNEKVFDDFQKEVDKFLTVVSDLYEMLEKGGMEGGDARRKGQELAKLTGLDALAQKAAQLAKELKPEFQKIEKKLG